ncbi:MAG: Ig-like domain-containing protein, partial [Ignavibacteria bacterium]
MKKFYFFSVFISFVFIGFTFGQNNPPVIDPISNQTMDEGDTLVVPISSTDPDGDNITLEVLNLPLFGAYVDSGNGKGSITFIPGLNSGTYPNIRVLAIDDAVQADSSSDFFRLTVDDVIGTPVIDAITSQDMIEGDLLVVPIHSVDPDGDFITLSVSGGFPSSFATFVDSGNGNGSITFLPGYSDDGTYNNIIVTATDDGNPTSSSTEAFRLNVADTTGAPVFHPIETQNVNEGDTLVVEIFSSDPEGDVITLSVTPNPITPFGVLTDNGDGTGFITFTPGFSDAATYFSRQVIATENSAFNYSSSEFFKLVVNDVGAPPVLDAIADTTMSEGDSLGITINSTDADGDTASLSVNNLPSFGNFTDNGDGTGLIWFLPGYDDANSYPNIQVIAMDNTALSDTTTFTLTVVDSNRAPVLNPISDKSMNEGDSLGIDVSSTDPDGDNRTLTAINFPSFGSFTDNSDGTGLFSFVPGIGDAGSYPGIQVIATDDGIPNLSDTTTFTLTVNVNSPPVLDAITNQNMDEDDSIGVNVNSTDPDADNITLTTNNIPSFGSFTDNGDGTGMFSFVTGFGDAGSYPGIQVIATDDGTPNLADTTTFTLTVGNVNRAPVVDAIADTTMNEDDSIGVDVSSTDPDGDDITLTVNNIPSFGSFADNGDGTGMFSFVTGFGDAGSYPDIQVIATDSGTPNLSDTTTFTLIVNDVNRAPVISAIPDTITNEMVPLDVTVNSTDPDGDDIVLTASNVPIFGSFTDNGNGTGMFSFSPGFGDAGSYPDIKVIATDKGSPSLSDSTTFRLIVGNVNRPPVIFNITNKSMNEGDSLGVDINSTDPDGDNLTLSVINLPAFGSLIDNGDGTGLISFLPDFGSTGSYPDIQVIVMDGGIPLLSDTTTFTLTVGDVNQPPDLDAIADTTMNENDSLGIVVNSSDPDGDNITLTISNLPSFGSFNDNGDGTGLISFLPGYEDAGNYPNIQVIATDDGSPIASNTTTFELTVNDVNRAPVLDAVADKSMNENDSLGIAVNSADPDGDTIALTVNNLPSFGNFTDNGDGTGLISFLPDFEDSGSYPNIQIIATDNGTPNLADTTIFTLTVNDVNRAPVIVPITDKNMDETDVLGVAVNSTDPEGDNITLSVNNLPSFGSFTDNGGGAGAFTFLPGLEDAGVYSNIQIIATDDGTPNESDTTSFTLTVGDVNHAPVLDPITDKNMNEGDSLDVSVNTTDSDADNNITLSVNNLPTFGSFTDNGDRTGMFTFMPGPGDAGTYTDITVIATDDGDPSFSDTAMFTLTVGIEAISDPDSLFATASVANRVELNWADSSDNEDGFIIEREDPDNPGFEAIDTVSANTVAYTDTTVIQGKRYNYRVKGYNTFTESGYAGPTEVVTLLPAPSNLTVQLLGSPLSVQLDWVDNSEDESGFVIERDSAGTGFVTFDTVGTNITSYIDSLVALGTTFLYRVFGFTADTTSEMSNTVQMDIPTDVIDVQTSLIPTEYELNQNYPNPFNPSTRIRFALPFESNVRLEIFNIIGELMAVLIDNEMMDVGFKEFEFNAGNLPSGIYLYRIIAANTDG